MAEEPLDMEPEGSPAPTAVLGPSQADPNIRDLKGGTESKAKHPHNSVALAEEDPQNLDVAKSSAASTELKPKRRSDIWWLVGAGVGAISLICIQRCCGPWVESVVCHVFFAVLVLLCKILADTGSSIPRV